MRKTRKGEKLSQIMLQIMLALEMSLLFPQSRKQRWPLLGIATSVKHPMPNFARSVLLAKHGGMGSMQATTRLPQKLTNRDRGRKMKQF